MANHSYKRIYINPLTVETTNVVVDGQTIPMEVIKPNWLWRFGMVRLVISYPGRPLLNKYDRVIVCVTLDTWEGKIVQKVSFEYRNYPIWQRYDLAIPYGKFEPIGAIEHGEEVHDEEFAKAFAFEARPALKAYKQLLDQRKLAGNDVVTDAISCYGVPFA